MAVLAHGVRQTARRHGGSMLQGELFGRSDFLTRLVLQLGFQHALEMQTHRHIWRRISTQTAGIIARSLVLVLNAKQQGYPR